MKISMKWIQDLVEVQDYFAKPKEIADLLTKAGLEVESIEDKAQLLQNVVVGQILEKAKHPNADKLSVCRVALGKGEVSQIVCGAKNHNVDDRVIVALPGATLPGGLTIKNASLRGVESSGMLCSYKELDMPGESEGIAILPKDAPVGMSYCQFMGLDDIVFELKVTPNRADCLSHFGIAREISALLGREMKSRPTAKLKYAAKSIEFHVELKAPDLCPRYAGRIIQNVKVGASPPWLRARLESLGMNSINNIVDVTNYVMLELGQPMHAFDLKNLRDHRLQIMMATAGESFETLKQEKKTLSGQELMIADGQGPVAIAGVIGGLNSGVSDKTQTIFLESAYFNPATVRKTSRALQLDTDSAYRFSRGVSAQLPPIALERATELILQLAGGEAEERVFDLYKVKPEKKHIEISIDRISKSLGYKGTAEKFKKYMLSLGFEVQEKSPEKFLVSKPEFRFDIEHEMDLIEEYARLNGYDQIPESFVPYASLPAQHDSAYILTQRLSQILQEEGFHRCFNLIFTDSKKEREFLGSRPAAVRLKNPLSEEQSELRTALLPSLFENAVYNYRQGNECGRLFEVDSLNQIEAAQSTTSELQKERLALGAIAWGHSQDLWSIKSPPPLVYSIKGLLENLFAKLGLAKDFTLDEFTSEKSSGGAAYLHPSQSAKVLFRKQVIGVFGTLHPSLAEKYKFRAPMALIEVSLEAVYAAAKQLRSGTRSTQSLITTPVVERDLAFVFSKSQPVGPVQKLLCEIAGAWMQNITVFDVFSGGSLRADEKSVAFKMWLQHPDKSFADAELNELLQKMIQQAKEQFGAAMR